MQKDDKMKFVRACFHGFKAMRSAKRCFQRISIRRVKNNFKDCTVLVIPPAFMPTGI